MPDYEPREIKLANELASTLKDWNGHQFYLQCARKHKESVLRAKLAYVMSKSDAEIKTTRGAYFNFLVSRDDNDSARR